MKASKILITVSIIYLILLEVLRVYFIMPFPGSQQQESIGIAYFLHTNMVALRIVGWTLVLIISVFSLSGLGKWWSIGLSIGVMLYGVVFYMFNFRFLADKMFYQPETIIFYNLIDNKVEQASLILGVEINGEAKAYPLEIIGYHHQVRDSVNGIPVMITYCTVCRTGRVFSPVVNGDPENFRLVGMDHFNAMFEDSSTKSWWRQATGEAIAGPLAGSVLEEFPSHQMSLRAWLELYPDSKILQPDSAFIEKYKKLKGFDLGTIQSHLLNRDTLSWKDKSWVIGISIDNQSRAYDWNDLVKHRIINDTLNTIPLLLYLEADSVSFRAWNRDSLHFYVDSGSHELRDSNTNSTWNLRGECIAGQLNGQKLIQLQPYQEFWHSWRTFHKNTTRYSFSTDND
jgi:hypothetical protein